MYSINRIFNTSDFLQKSSLFWQYPVITEKEFFHQNKFTKLSEKYKVCATTSSYVNEST